MSNNEIESKLGSYQSNKIFSPKANKSVSKSKLEELYLNRGLSQRKIAAKYNVSEALIRSWLKRFNITSRKNSETKSFHLNLAFFENESIELAWVLGILFTDGYFRRNKTIVLSMKDLDVLEKVSNLVSSNLEVKKVKNNKEGYIYQLEFSNEKISKILISYGLSFNKSLDMKFPLINQKFISHFMRGCWDGDGGFSYSRPDYLTAHYTCGSRDFIYKIGITLFKDAKVIRKTLRRDSPSDNKLLRKIYGDGPYPCAIHKRKSSNAYDIRIAGLENLKNLFQYLYKDTSSDIYMDRKFNIINNYLKSKTIEV